MRPSGLVIFLVCAPAWPSQEIVQLFSSHCAPCHNQQTKLSELNVESRQGLLQGGRRGPAIVVGRHQESRLYQWVAEGKMPPGKRLNEADVRRIAAWIDAGAPWPAASSHPTANQTWWAFQPPVKPSGGSIDFFIEAKLRQHGLALNPPADHRTLIRRLCFDLTGLPPEPSDYALTYEQAVDRYLASPRYGERWARHWLDVVRFGETDGGEHNHERLQAWPYRDWVIQSLNADLPYDQFVREQIAGDVLSPEDPKRVAATGFLVAGPWDSVSAVLNKDATLKLQARMDELDDMVTTVSHSFLALTVNCARCHDHKFDPIPTRDYYRMTAFFTGVGFGEREVGSEEERQKLEQQLKPLREELAQRKRDLATLEDPPRARILAARYAAFDQQRASAPRRIPLNPVWNRNAFPATKSQRFRLVVLGHVGERARLSYLELLPAGHRVTNWTAQRLASADQPEILEIELGQAVEVNEIRWASDPEFARREGSISIYRFEVFEPGSGWRLLCSSLDHVGAQELDLPAVEDSELESALDGPAQEKRRQLMASIQALEKQLEVAPSSKIFAAKPREPEKSYVLERGNVTRRGEEVGPATLSAIPLPSPNLEGASAGLRRLALANWIADPRNPLTARVIVNRVWHWHFGNGIVNTPSDFGVNGERPSHPELLDWLAVSFMENGWSLKWLHRQIVLSKTYRQSSTFQAKAHAIDAGNRLLWRMPLKRMDAETLRDSILWASGNLNLRMGGPSFQLQKKGTRGSYIYKALDVDGPEVWRRTVYRFVVRGGERLMIDSFDCPDPSVATPQRAFSNTPVQALTLLNNEFVVRQASYFAQRLLAEAGLEGVIERAYQILFGRQPTAEELARDRRFLENQPLALYCRVLFNSNEFVYVP
ncbi:MAG: DUF1553 domain-containing protein [Bryobacteraceae bacterium]|nr:DUF1553 domain-containing protein [Bryobacteraceae bacterium]MDW8376948.1 PSD1 and planctomycete cytochrome C domain-containing protein [Bryobacterales bacterium]